MKLKRKCHNRIFVCVCSPLELSDFKNKQEETFQRFTSVFTQDTVEYSITVF